MEGFDGRDSYTILEIKTCDTYIAHQHTATSRGAAHRFLERTFAPGQYTMPAHQLGAPRLRLFSARQQINHEQLESNFESSKWSLK